MNRFLLAAIALGVTACAGPSQINDDKVFFEFDSAVISDDARDELESQALYMKKNPDVNIILEGHCDEPHVIIADGIEPERIKTISYGKERPQYPGTGEEVWALNRNATTKVVDAE